MRQKSEVEVTVWGTGTPMREFLHVDDMAAASIHVANLSKSEYQSVTNARCSHLNVGSGSDLPIRALAVTIAETIGYRGKIIWDSSKPDGTPKSSCPVRKYSLLDGGPRSLSRTV